MNESEYIFYIELYCQKIFREDTLTVFGVGYRSLANHLSAFLCSKKTLGGRIVSKKLRNNTYKISILPHMDADIEKERL